MFIFIFILFSSLSYAGPLTSDQCLEKDNNCILERSTENSYKHSAETKRYNINGSPLAVCSSTPLTGFYRDGTCHSDKSDHGNHSVCARVTTEFLQYTKQLGNDLITPNPRYGFPGLKNGDYWCLCANRWLEAQEYGILLQVNTKATSLRALEVIDWHNLIGEKFQGKN